MIYRCKILGVTIYKKRIRQCQEVDYVFNIPVHSRKSQLGLIYNEFQQIKTYDNRKTDESIAKLASTLLPDPYLPSPSTNDPVVAFLATELADSGGHTKCVVNLAKMFCDNYSCKIFLTAKENALKNARKSMKELSQYIEIDGLDFDCYAYKKLLAIFWNKIMHFNPKVVFVFSHMDDIFSTMILALLKKHTQVKVIYFNHGSHLPAMGFSFADLIIEGMRSTQYFTKHYRKHDRCHVLGLPSKGLDRLYFCSDIEIRQQRKELGIKGNEYLLASGGAGYKFFDALESPYFIMLKEIMKEDSNIKCAILSNFNKEEHKIINDIFENTELRNRLIIRPLTTQYGIFFQACDVYVDSFPIGGAMLQVELMGLKVPTVVKINRENAKYSFHEYYPPDYQFMFDNLVDMKNGILELVYDREKRRLACEKNYEHYLKHFEENALKNRYIELIENSDNLEKFYDELNETDSYNFINEESE